MVIRLINQWDCARCGDGGLREYAAAVAVEHRLEPGCMPNRLRPNTDLFYPGQHV